MVFLKLIPRSTFLITISTRSYHKEKVINIGHKCKRTFCSNPKNPKNIGKSPREHHGKHSADICGKSEPQKAAKLDGKDKPPSQIALTRPIRQEPGNVRLGFLPEEWFEYFYPKTGVSGPYIFLIAVGTYLVSKEKYVLEHEYYSLLSVTALCAVAAKSVGPAMSRYIDKEIEMYEQQWKKKRNDEIAHWEDLIKHEERLQISSAGQLILLDAKRENVKFQLESAYRRRFVQVHDTVLDRLNYHFAVEHVHRRLTHKNLVEWVVKEVIQAYKAEKFEGHIDLCIDELSAIAAKETKATVQPAQ